MKIKTISLIVLALLFFSAVGSTNQSRRNLQVSGRAVDNNGDPIADVMATLYSEPCHGCIDNVVPSNRSFGEGFFSVDSSGLVGERFTLYLTEVVPAGYWSPLDGAPFNELAHLPEFRGIPLTLTRRRSRIDLGAVKVRIRFGKVVLRVPEEWKDLAAESTALVLRLRDRTGRILDNELPLSVANAKSDSVKLALTSGRWKVQLLLRHNDQRLSSPVRNIMVKPGNCETITLTNSSSPKPCTN